MAANFGELVLLLGDHHIPSRSLTIPEPFQRMLVPGKMQRVLCTGNLGGSKEEFDRLKELVGGNSSSVHCVAGEYDFLSSSGAAAAAAGGGGGGGEAVFPETKVIQLGNFRVGIIGGKMKEDILYLFNAISCISISQFLSCWHFLLSHTSHETSNLSSSMALYQQYPGHQVVPWGDLSALSMVRRRLNVDVLVCGQKRKEGVVEHEGMYGVR